jgi:hypothetical protein
LSFNSNLFSLSQLLEILTLTLTLSPFFKVPYSLFVISNSAFFLNFLYTEESSNSSFKEFLNSTVVAVPEPSKPEYVIVMCLDKSIVSVENNKK